MSHNILPTTDINAWVKSVNITEQAHALISNAAHLAAITGEDQPTPFGNSCLIQGLETAKILIDLEFDTESIAAAILYSTVEYTDLSLTDIADQLGARIAELIHNVQRMNLIDQSTQRLNRDNVTYIDNLRKMLLAMVQDVRAVVIKLADQLAMLRAIQPRDDKTKKHMAHVAMEIFAPLANRLGLHRIKQELEDISFGYLEHEAYRDIAKKLAESKAKRQVRVKKIVGTLETILKNAGIKANVYGRAKHIYSIKRKMTRKNVDLSQIYDAIAVRILAPTIQDCYAILSLAHENWESIPEEFDDYIATPKPNGYQSIHTAVLDEDNKAFEIQIRTHDMHENSEKGVAAHWMYKEGKQEKSSYEAKIAWLRQLLEWQKSFVHDTSAPEILEKSVLEDRVYTFTPAGDIIDLPAGATSLDFAYHIHTEVGHRCRGAKINGKMVPLTVPVKTGDTIEVLTTKNSSPSRDWLIAKRGYLKTSTARAKVLQWFKRQDFQTHVAAGRSTLDRELQRLALPPQNLENIAKKLDYQSADHLLATLGRGHLKLARITQLIHDQIEPIMPAALAAEDSLPVTLRKPTASSKNPVNVAGVGNLLSHIAQCCQPVPGDPIIGYITQSRGIAVHHLDCKNITYENTMHPARLIKVHWNAGTTQHYPITIAIMSYDRPGLLQDISAALIQDNINILTINSQSNQAEHTVKTQLTVEVESLDLLSKILERIDHIPNVYQVYRKKNSKES